MHTYAPKVDKSEVLRYLGYKGTFLSPDMNAFIENCIHSALEIIAPKCLLGRYPIVFGEDGIHVQGTTLILHGRDIARQLLGCSSIFLLCATVGVEMDRLIRIKMISAPDAGTVLDSCGSSAVESLCNMITADISAQCEKDGLFITPRFSPGYGDLPLEIQPKLIAALEAEKRIGLTCTQSLIMIPRKSVTAIVGVGAKTQYITTENENCKACSLNETCSFKKGSGACGYSENTEE